MEAESAGKSAEQMPIFPENLPIKNGKVPNKESEKMQENQGLGVHSNGKVPIFSENLPIFSENLPNNPSPNERKENSETISSSIPRENAVEAPPPHDLTP